MGESQADRVEYRDDALRRWGTRSWLLLGILAAGFAVFSFLATITGLVIPLLVAMVIGMLFVPLVDRLAAVMPRPVAAAVVLLGLVVVSAASITLAVGGVIDQAPEISRGLSDGFDALIAWLDDLDLQVGQPSEFVDGLADLWSKVVPGLAGYLGTVFTSTAAFFAGTFVAVFMLYFILADWEQLAGWVARHLGVSDEVGGEIVDDTTWSMRQYFLALTVSSVIVAVIVGASAVIMDVPLAASIAVVTFFTSYIPYLGALFSGAFAVLIALGSGGPRDALIILLVVLVAQNVVQTIVQTKMSEGRLKLHPIVIFGSTILGGAVFGLLGAALSTPAVAVVVRVAERLRDAREVAEPDPAPDAPTDVPA